jgi:CDP-glycerol glycerophosphotransferase (TagB/SpsB family)
VILLRGHRFHSPAGHGAQVIDVTGYPEVNDLILAADAAVLDYSSLRFDFALTGHPMVFLVPDLKHYTEETRGFLYDFADSAPGPLVDSTMEVVEALADLPALEREWSPRISEFNAHYNRLADGRAAERVVAEFFAPLLG